MQRRCSGEGHGGRSARSVASRSSLKLEIIIILEKRHYSSMSSNLDEYTSVYGRRQDVLLDVTQ
jgi:hypothetical protein